MFYSAMQSGGGFPRVGSLWKMVPHSPTARLEMRLPTSSQCMVTLKFCAWLPPKLHLLLLNSLHVRFSPPPPPLHSSIKIAGTLWPPYQWGWELGRVAGIEAPCIPSQGGGVQPAQPLENASSLPSRPTRNLACRRQPTSAEYEIFRLASARPPSSASELRK